MRREINSIKYMYINHFTRLHEESLFPRGGREIFLTQVRAYVFSTRRGGTCKTYTSRTTWRKRVRRNRAREHFCRGYYVPCITLSHSIAGTINTADDINAV